MDARLTERDRKLHTSPDRETPSVEHNDSSQTLLQFPTPWRLVDKQDVFHDTFPGMKFCKNLQRVVEISDPEWAPFYTNYKWLKKLIKDLPSLVPSEVTAHKGPESRAESPDSLQARRGPQGKLELEKEPAEKAFFKVLHAELRKASRFFADAERELEIRERRVSEGIQILNHSELSMVNEQWSVVAKSIFSLYKELLLLETYAIMNFCAFSKILKKHDKNTGFNTRQAFMDNVVSKANFNNYPKVLAMIQRCEALYEQVSSRIMEEGKEALFEDERLFINMISRLNAQVLEHPDSEGMNGADGRKPCKPVASLSGHKESQAVSTLRSIVEDTKNAIADVSVDHVEESVVDRKRPAQADLSKCLLKRVRSDDA